MLADFHETYLKPQPETVFAVIGEKLDDAATAIKDWISDASVPATTADDGILFKAPKPTQDRRADLPVIGMQTVMGAAEAGLAGIVIEAEGVIVLNLKGVIEALDAQGMFLWVRPRGAA